ncbi:MAG: GIY-YIG nuclease family protein [Alphaproteobacteria bacterium]|nr:GIY-YIG nuclease family protein [Alphaproteobacteria bacterium]
MSDRVFVYIITNKANGTLYIGQTNDLARRMMEHKNGLFQGFSKRYGLKKLVYYEIYDNPMEGFARERAMKKWNRSWKIQAIISMNMVWRDLTDDLNK